VLSAKAPAGPLIIEHLAPGSLETAEPLDLRWDFAATGTFIPEPGSRDDGSIRKIIDEPEVGAKHQAVVELKLGG
jgi:hypothetical protein